MAGLLAAAIGGAVAGAGQGMAEAGKEAYTDQNLRLKAKLDTDRESYLADLNNAAAQTRTETQVTGSKDVANIGAAAQVQTTGMQVEGRHQDVGAEVAGRSADTAAQAAAHVQGAQISAGATVGAAQIHADAQREFMRNRLQVSEDGMLYQVNQGPDGKPIADAVTGPDDEPLRVSKNLNAADASKITTLTMLIKKEEDGLKTKTGAGKIQAQQRIDDLYLQLANVNGIERSPSPATPPSGRPPLSTFVK